MFKYKSKSFYNKFFNNVNDFKLVSPFEEDEGGFKGVIESIGTYHPIIIDVNIPKHFPHQRMLFWTNSLYGYPHLIYSSQMQKSWFCLNTPFAETAENQLRYELDRLRGWIKKMMHEDLPACIEDPTLQRSLRFANIFSWEVFENDEYSSDSSLIFIGDFANDANNFSKFGSLYCKRIEINETESRFYAFQENNDGFEEIPYVIVEGRCDSFESLESMSAFYGFDDETWNKLLPFMQVWERCFIDKFQLVGELRKNIDAIEKDLHEVYIPEEHRFYIEEFVDWIKQSDSPIYLRTEDNLLDGAFQMGQTMKGEELVKIYLDYVRKRFYFALGIKSGTKLTWYLFSTFKDEKFTRRINYRLGGSDITVNEYIDIRLTHHVASVSDYQHFFGRGAMSENLSEKRIAIIGVGAIGSCLLETIVRSGARNISIWDGDKVEPGNICRSIYTLDDLGMSKVSAATRKMKAISPFCSIAAHGYDLYGSINYNSQEKVNEELNDFDIIFDCTASNELLHYLSYTFPHKTIISLCITNHANDLLCLSSYDGNPYDQRKAFLSMIEQDTDNFYAEGTGCYSPTFLAANSDISYLVNLFVSRLYSFYEKSLNPRTLIISNDSLRTTVNVMHTYKLKGKNIRMSILDKTYKVIETLPESYDYAIGYLLGVYSEDYKQIFVCFAIQNEGASESLEEVFNFSEGVIDYIGEIHYSGIIGDTFSKDVELSIRAKAQSESINTNNPLLALRNPDGSISFYLYFNGDFIKFIEQ